MNDDDIKKEALVRKLRQVIETAATTLQYVALDREQAAASMLGVVGMFFAEAVGAMTGNATAERDIHLTASKALDGAYPERSVLREEELS